jgi:hypothetical protein
MRRNVGMAAMLLTGLLLLHRDEELSVSCVYLLGDRKNPEAR